MKDGNRGTRPVRGAKFRPEAPDPQGARKDIQGRGLID
jgi:hypothetical protein